MKRFLCLMLALILAFSLFACKSGGEEGEKALSALLFTDDQGASLRPGDRVRAKGSRRRSGYFPNSSH